MKIRHVYHPGLITHCEEVQIKEQRQFLPNSFFHQLSSRDDFVNDNSIFVIINVHIQKPSSQYNKTRIQTIFEWFRQGSRINHIIQYIHEHFDFDTSKYVLRNEDNNKIYRDTNEILPKKDRYIFSFERDETL